MLFPCLMTWLREWSVASTVLVTALVSAGAHVQAQSPDRHEAAEQESKAETAHQRSLVERFLFKLEDDLLLDRWLNAPRGIYLRLGGIGEGAGFGAGPAFRFNTDRFDFKTSAAGSLKKYFVGEASLRFPGTIGEDAYFTPVGPFVELYGRRRDFPQEDFFGLGPNSNVDARSNYALRDTTATLTGGYRFRQLNAGVTAGHLDVDIGRGEDTRMPSATDRFSPAELIGSLDQPEFFTVAPFVELSTRDRSTNEVGGGDYRISWTHYDDRKLGRYSFNRIDADLRQYIAFVKSSRSIALRAWVSSSDAAVGQEVPFYLQPTLGGARTLRGYRSFRFRDRSALLLQAEYRWRINQLVSGAVFFDTGAVARELSELGRFERDYGFGLRAGGRMGSAFRLDFAFGGREGHRILLRFDDAF